LRILGPRSIAYLDVTGSGAETAAHLRENGRIVMFCELTDTPKILRLHGTRTVNVPGSAHWDELAPQFTTHPGIRSIVKAEVTRISDSCGFGRLIDGVDVIVVQSRGKNLTRDGQRYDNDYAFVIHFRDGRIARYEEYCDTELIARVLPDRKAAKSLLKLD
jgi:hypothetical protein